MFYFKYNVPGGIYFRIHVAAGGHRAAPVYKSISIGESLDGTGAESRDVGSVAVFPSQGGRHRGFVQRIFDDAGVSPVARSDAASRDVAVIEVEKVSIGKPVNIMLADCIVGGVFCVLTNISELVA